MTRDWDEYGDYIEEDFWDDRTTPLAYSQQDSERDLEVLRKRKVKEIADYANELESY